MFATPTSPLSQSKEIASCKNKSKESALPVYINPNTLERTIPTSNHAQIVVAGQIQNK